MANEEVAIVGCLAIFSFMGYNLLEHYKKKPENPSNEMAIVRMIFSFVCIVCMAGAANLSFILIESKYDVTSPFFAYGQYIMVIGALILIAYLLWIILKVIIWSIAKIFGGQS